MKKSIIYCRVSTDDQAKLNGSLASQERICRDYAARHDYEVVKIFVDDGESAKTTERPQLQNLLTFISQNKIDTIIFYKIDRFARNAEDYTTLKLITKRFGIKLRSATENINDTPSGRFSENVLAAVAQLDNDVRSERTATGMKQALLEGRWPWRPHLGYTNGRNSLGKSILIPSMDAPFVIKAFTLAATGLYKKTDIVKELKKEGFKKLNEKRLGEVLRKSVYAGVLEHKWLSEPIDGVHKPLISKDTFSKVQLILDGKRPRMTSYNRNNPLFPLRNFVRCPECSKKLTGGLSTGRKGVKYGFYRCYTKGCSLSAKKHELEHRFQEHLKSYESNKTGFDLFEAVLLDVWKTKQSKQIKDHSQIEQSIKNLTAKKNLLYEFLMKGTIDDETYKIKIKEISEEISTKKIEMSETNVGMDNDFEGCLRYCRFFMTNIAPNWERGNIDLKQRFQALLFPAKIYYDHGTFRTTATPLIFKLLQHKSPDLSCLVAPTGKRPL